MPPEPEPPLHLFQRNHLRLKFNFENICRKYEKMKESGVEIDLEEDAFYTAKNTERRLANKTKQLFYAVNDNWGLCPISAPFNNIENLDGNNSLQQKCAKRDEEFNGEILAVTPYEPTNQLVTAKRKYRETITEETYTAEGLSVAQLESTIRENGSAGEIIYRGVENNTAVIRVRYSKQIGFVDDNHQQKTKEDDTCDEVAREFANIKRGLLLQIQAPSSSSSSLLAIKPPPTAEENDVNEDKLSGVDMLDEVAREFINVKPESLKLSQSLSVESDDKEERLSGVQMPTTRKIMNYKRMCGSSLELSPKSKKSCQRSFDRIDEVDEVFKKVQTAETDYWNEESASSLYGNYLSASEKLKSVFGVDIKDLNECPPANSLLIDFWVNSTAFWKDKAPSLFTCDFFKHEERRQFSAARERNHHLQYGFV